MTFIFKKGKIILIGFEVRVILTEDLKDKLECFPVIAAIREERFNKAIDSSAQVLFYLEANLLTVKERIEAAHKAKKTLFVHLDLADGIGKDKAGIEYLANCGVDGIISTRAQIIRIAKELGLLTVQRFFLLDSQGVDSAWEVMKTTLPDFIELMPGIIPKLISRFAKSSVPVIAGGLIETKAEITSALGSGAAAISTGSPKLWEM